MTPEDNIWKRCSTCKKGLAFASPYWVCNVSTCNRGNTALAFCSVDCWDAHVPMVRHRDSWAEEERAPRRDEWERQQREAAAAEARASERATRRIVTPPTASAASPAASNEPIPREILVIASRLKAYIRARSGFNTSDGTLDVLSDRLRALSDEAIRSARAAGRQTVMDRDIP